jgi:hypothetical protein
MLSLAARPVTRQGCSDGSDGSPAAVNVRTAFAVQWREGVLTGVMSLAVEGHVAAAIINSQQPPVCPQPKKP